MFFRSVDDCKYYASRLNNQPAVPNRRGGEDRPKTISYTAVCEIRKVDPKTTLVYKQVQNFDGVGFLTIYWYKYPSYNPH